MHSIFVSIPESRRVLDFGCGTGWVTSEAQTVNQPLKIGIDYSFQSLVAGKEKHQDINFIKADGLFLPFADAAFDVVIGHVSMPYMNTEKALREIYRVLAPGGSVLLTFHSFRYMKRRFALSTRKLNLKDTCFTLYMGLNGLLNHWSIPQIQTPWKPAIFETVSTPDGVCKTATKVGFNMVSAEYTKEHIFFAFSARKITSETQNVLPAPSWSSYIPLSPTAK